MKTDHRIIYEIVEENSKVLDLGSGSGELLEILMEGKGVNAHAIEKDEKMIYQCVEKGINVFHGDFEEPLEDYPDDTFDYVILNQSLQEVQNLLFVLEESLRVGRKVIIGFPNFANLRARAALFFKGRSPVTRALPYQWYDTPNLRFLSISDFRVFCVQKKIKVVNEYCFRKKKIIKFLPNIFAENAVFLLEKE